MPQDWQDVSLGDVATVERFGIQPGDIRDGTAYVGLKNIKSGGTLIDVRVVDAGDLASSKFRFTSRHILYGKLRPYLAKIASPEFDGICSTDIVPILPGPEADRRYLVHYLRQPSIVALANSRTTGINLPRVAPSALAELPIPLPPLTEQQRIADILDKADSLRAERRAVLQRVDLLADAIFRDLFGDPVSNPKGWPADQALGDVAYVVSGLTKGRKLHGQSTRSVPYLAVLNVQDKRLDLSTVKTIDASGDEIARWRLQRHDLLLTEGGDPDKLGRGTLWSDELPEAIHQNHIFRVRLHTDRLRPVFLNWLIGTNRGKQYFLKSAKQTTGIASINMTQLRGFPLLIPPTSLQDKFAQALTALNLYRDRCAASLMHLDDLFSSLQHRAFDGDL
jgi:type I restriction enzyme S subunit